MFDSPIPWIYVGALLSLLLSVCAALLSRRAMTTLDKAERTRAEWWALRVQQMK